MASFTGRPQAVAGAIVVLVVMLGASVGEARTAPSESGCASAGYRQFDFWIGTWDVFDLGGLDRVATAVITPVQGGCGLREQYQGVDGRGGESLTAYDPRSDTWRQSWVSDRGQMVIIEGRRQDGAITLAGPEYGGALGRTVRGRWAPLAGGQVRESAQRSTDGGRSWSPWFDIVFKRRGVGSRAQP